MADVYRFADFTLDAGAFELRRGPVVVPLEPLVLDLIRVLVEQPGVVLGRDTLMETVWQGRIVAESTISTAIKSARRALGDTGRDQKFIRTVRGRGIQFAVPVEVVAAAAATAGQPALYIRPFDTMGDARLDQLARALRVRTASVLARVPLLRIASAHAEADQVTDPRRMRSGYRVTHLLQVRLQRVGRTLKADAALTETRQGLQVWAGQFETPAGAGDQEILLYRLTGRIEPQLMQAMVTEMRAARGEEASRANLLQAIVLLSQKGWHRDTFRAATGMIEQSLAQEPDFALSHAYLALLKALGHRVGLLRDDDAVVAAAVAAAERALELENQDSTILGLVGCALADVGQVDRAIPILQKAIELDPHNGHAKTALGAALMIKRDYAAAAAQLAAGIDCSPADSRRSVWGAALALARLAQGDPDGALVAAEIACRDDDRIYLPRLALAAVHLARRDQDAAIAAVRECLRTKPDLSRAEITCVVGEKLGAGVWAVAGSLVSGDS